MFWSPLTNLEGTEAQITSTRWITKRNQQCQSHLTCLGWTSEPRHNWETVNTQQIHSSSNFPTPLDHDISMEFRRETGEEEHLCSASESYTLWPEMCLLPALSDSVFYDHLCCKKGKRDYFHARGHRDDASLSHITYTSQKERTWATGETIEQSFLTVTTAQCSCLLSPQRICKSIILQH